jgi:hypothetical protein
MRVADFGFWPEAAQIDVRLNVGKWGITGLVVLTMSFVSHDPKRNIDTPKALDD